MTNFILGVLSSIVATGILYGFRYQIGPVINFIFFKVFPKVEGDYLVIPYDNSSDSDEESESYEYEAENDETMVISQSSHETLEAPNGRNFSEVFSFLQKTDPDPSVIIQAKIKQFANKVWGEMITTQNGKQVEITKFKGVVKPSRVLILTSEDKTEGHHDFGTMLLNLSQDSRYLNGTRTYLCATCANAGGDHIIFEKQ